MPTESLPADDPERFAAARPWRQRAWERVPGWAKIGLIAFGTLAVIHVALAIRIWYGLQDPPAVIALQQNHRNDVLYEVDPIDASSDVVDWVRNLAIGLRGRSTDDVTAIYLGHGLGEDETPLEGPTDKDLKLIAQHFPNLDSLEVMCGTCTTKGFMSLKACSHLTHLTVHDIDVDDELAELLPHLPELTSLTVNFTNTGDGLVTAAIQHKNLAKLDVQGTRVTQAALDAWKAAKPYGLVAPANAPTGLDSFVRWSDGTATWFFHNPSLVEIQGPYDPNATTPWPRASLEYESWVWSNYTSDQLERLDDGRYRLIVSLILKKTPQTDAELFELLPATPVEFDVVDGVSTPSRVELQLPITRAEAIRRLTRDDDNLLQQWVKARFEHEGISPRKKRVR
jgi:hypothetical protein